MSALPTAAAVEPDLARDLAERFAVFLETGTPPPGTFAADVFCDFTMPQWRLQALGHDDVVAMRLESHPGPGRVQRTRFDPTPTGFVLEFEERWEAAGNHWYCREMVRADIVGGSISTVSVYCTGDWDDALQARHAREVTLLRP